jgi:hypothetical protein
MLKDSPGPKTHFYPGRLFPGRALIGMVILYLMASCSAQTPGAPGSSSGATATPLPTPPSTVEGICMASAAVLNRLDGEFKPGAVTTETLVDQGTVVATITGVLASDLARLRTVAAPPSGASDWKAWIAALQAVVDAGVRTVHASAAGNVAAFEAAAAEMLRARQAARDAGSVLGYQACPY